ncbi:hypothetical protein GobsT_23090 [Gemmata obscuriglobus]|uniref:Glycosyltransferase RgtA/B/C/D-like domain-containing protein n=1 Tax=Gemmata obscuriglobus TaxID=114 RepID=A0A2Z3H709_9BACT|nr:hypothetical protein [Gemmata obscuriglobus]AWM39376.1 hypothetical protein C1280_21900 [Gemmata obscuriglobus]QEG27553.1 hypothetical protein GobsT_23090 [Gemmata obscuriglobus]
MGELVRRLLRCCGPALLVVAVGALGLAKADSYYGTLLRGFDAQFYYAAARSVVVSGDWDVTDDLPLGPAQGPFRTDAGTPRRADGGIKNVFPVGLSLLEGAFLLPARALTTIAGGGSGPVGYTRPEVGFVALGLLLAAGLGVQITFALVRTLVSTPVAAVATIAAWLGTPLLYYTAWFPFSVHPTTFCIMVLLLLLADRIPHARRSNVAVFVFAVLASALYLTRPHQSPYILVLVAWRGAPLLRRGWRAWGPGAGAGLVVGVAALVFQAQVHAVNVGARALIAHGTHDHPMITGHFVSAPDVFAVLLSPARGLFWVTPVVLLALVGYVWRWRDVPWWGWASLANAALQTTILAFWSDPGQGDSFGVRLWVEHVPVVACGLAVLAGGAFAWGRIARAVLAAVLLACVSWTLLLCACYVSGRLRTDQTHREVVSQAVSLVLRR